MASKRRAVPTKQSGRWHLGAHYVLLAYPFVFIAGVIGVFWIFITTSDPSLFSAGLMGGYIFVGLSVLALFSYPAYRIDAATIRAQSDWEPTFRLYLVVCLGVPLGVGLLFELLSGTAGGRLSVPGLLAAFVAAILHPIVVFFAVLGYLLQRKRKTGRL